MGVALQLVNIARDVREDARNGRIYIPESWFVEGCAIEKLGINVPARPELLEVLRSFARSSSSSSVPDPNVLEKQITFPWSLYTLPLLALSDHYASLSRPALSLLPPEVRPGARAAVASYLLIGDEVRRRGGDIRGELTNEPREAGERRKRKNVPGEGMGKEGYEGKGERRVKVGGWRRLRRVVWETYAGGW
jgi:hypothetical protein